MNRKLISSSILIIAVSLICMAAAPAAVRDQGTARPAAVFSSYKAQLLSADTADAAVSGAAAQNGAAAETDTEAETALAAQTETVSGNDTGTAAQSEAQSETAASEAAQETGESQMTQAEADASVEDVALSIKKVLVSSSALYDADKDDVEKLQDDISGIKDAYEALPQDRQNDLEGSYKSLENAEVSVESAGDAKSGDVSIEENDKPNSFRYINGEPIKEALNTVNLESKESTGEKLDAVSGEAQITAGDTGKSAQNMFYKSSGSSLRAEMLTASAVTYNGIDVSEWQDDIDWLKVKNSGVKFAIIRCGYGSNKTSYDDDYWEENAAACEKYGIPYGVYLYSYADSTSDVDSEAAHTLRLLAGHHPSLPVFYDMEENEQLSLGASVCSAFAQRYCSAIAAAGYKTGLYASMSYYEDLFGAFASNGNYYHWVAQYNSAHRCDYSGRYEGFQYSSTGAVSGIAGNVDMDYWYSTLETNASYPSSSSSVRNVDLSGVSFANKTVIYNGSSFSYPAVSDLPAGVSVSYSVSGTQKNIGVYSITASFTAKSSAYRLVNAGSKTAYLTITVKKGGRYTVGKLKYRISSANTNGSGTVSVTAPKYSTYKGVTIPSTVKIGGVRFKVTTVGKNAFRNNYYLKKIAIGNNVRTISAGSFRGCVSLSKVTIGTSATGINGAAFYGDYNLRSVIIKGSGLSKISKNAFKKINAYAVIKVPYASLAAYKQLFSYRTGFRSTMSFLTY